MIPAQFEQAAEEFSSGAAVVGRQYKKVWFIDKSGGKLFGREFEAASSFRLGLAHVRTGPDFSYIDRSGKTVFSYRESAERR